MKDLVIGISGLTLTDQEKEWMHHPELAGVILFSRNYESRDQVAALNASIKGLNSELFICVDHEGGSVQRFREGFSVLPNAAEVTSVEQSYDIGQTMGRELSAVGVDINFSPVVDVLHPGSDVLRGRCYSEDPMKVAALAMAQIKGMEAAGVEGVIKHFPGHGSVAGDTHFETVVDMRPFDEIWAHDLVAFRECANQGAKHMMAAWVTYPEVDALPASFSPIWLKDIARDKCGFTGKIFSDDIGMAAANMDNPIDAVKQARVGGCDYILLCNDVEMISSVLN